MPSFRLEPDDWPRLESLAKDGSIPVVDIIPAEYSNLQRCGAVYPRRNGRGHALAVTPAGYALLAERERWRGRGARSAGAVGESRRCARCKSDEPVMLDRVTLSQSGPASENPGTRWDGGEGFAKRHSYTCDLCLSCYDALVSWWLGTVECGLSDALKRYDEYDGNAAEGGLLLSEDVRSLLPDVSALRERGRDA